jgi:hypothetical protein
MKIQRLLLAAAILALFAALPTFATSAPVTQVHASTAPVANPPPIDAFLASLAQPAASCGPGFCTQAERDACNQQCRGHKFFVGLECCSNCTTLCICGSVPVAC